MCFILSLRGKRKTFLLTPALLSMTILLILYYLFFQISSTSDATSSFILNVTDNRQQICGKRPTGRPFHIIYKIWVCVLNKHPQNWGMNDPMAHLEILCSMSLLQLRGGVGFPTPSHRSHLVLDPGPVVTGLTPQHAILKLCDTPLVHHKATPIVNWYFTYLTYLLAVVAGLVVRVGRVAVVMLVVVAVVLSVIWYGSGCCAVKSK